MHQLPPIIATRLPFRHSLGSQLAVCHVLASNSSQAANLGIEERVQLTNGGDEICRGDGIFVALGRSIARFLQHGQPPSLCICIPCYILNVRIESSVVVEVPLVSTADSVGEHLMP